MKQDQLSIVGLKALRENINTYIRAVERGDSFVVVRKSKPVFKISSLNETNELWERVVDFTTVKKSGIALDQLLSRL